jgi:hypothetical protein
MNVHLWLGANLKLNKNNKMDSIEANEMYLLDIFLIHGIGLYSGAALEHFVSS